MMLGLGLRPKTFISGIEAPWWEQLYPEATFVADFVNNRSVVENTSKSLSDFLSITRNSEGYATNTDGSLVHFGANEFRLSNRGILIEPQSENILTHSQNFTSSDWNILGSATVASDDTVAPDGNQTADLVDNLAATNDGIKFIDPLSASIADNTYIFSIYLRADIPDQLEIIIGAEQGSINTTNLTVDLSQQWQRYTLAHSFASDNSNFSIQLHRPAGSTLSSFHTWGAQLETGTYETSYIPTTTTPSTRQADAISFTDLSWLDTTTGTIVMRVQSDHGTISNRRLLGFASAQGLDTSPAANVVEEWNGTTLLEASTYNTDWVSGAKVGLSWDTNGRSLCIGAGGISGDNELVNGLSSWHLGSRNGTHSFWTGYQKEIVYWDIRKSDIELNDLTA